MVDGDSLRCGAERLSLLGIDAPELHGCPPKRTCVDGDGQAAKRSIAAGIRQGRFRFERVGKNPYGRSLVVAWAGGGQPCLLADQARLCRLCRPLG